MSYSTGMMHRRVAIFNASNSASGDFGSHSSGVTYTYATTVWAAVDFNRGTKSLREGALDAYDRIMVRMRWNNTINRRSKLVWDGKTFQIESFNADRYLNTIQVTAVELPGEDLASGVPQTQENV